MDIESTPAHPPLQRYDSDMSGGVEQSFKTEHAGTMSGEFKARGRGLFISPFIIHTKIFQFVYDAVSSPF